MGTDGDAHRQMVVMRLIMIRVIRGSARRASEAWVYRDKRIRITGREHISRNGVQGYKGRGKGTQEDTAMVRCE
jgi:hypothetical protein